MDHFERYGFDRSQLSAFLLGCSPDVIGSKAVLAPCWSPQSVGISDARLICGGAHQIWDCRLDNIPFTYIVAGVGAGNCSDVVMSLQGSNCRKMLFLGSAGSITPHAAVGDLVVPDCVACGDGLCRYLFDDLRQDRFGELCFPTEGLQQQILHAAVSGIDRHPELGIRCHTGKSASVETVYSQFRHLDTFREIQCAFLDMESTAFLKSAEAAKIEDALVFCISDNALTQQSLVTVSEALTRFRKDVRRILMPGIITAFLAAD